MEDVMAEAAETLSVDEKLEKLKAERSISFKMASGFLALAAAFPYGASMFFGVDDLDKAYSRGVESAIHQQVDEAVQQQVYRIKKDIKVGFENRASKSSSSFNLSASGAVDYNKLDVDAKGYVEARKDIAGLAELTFSALFSILGLSFAKWGLKEHREIKKLESANSKPSDPTL
jgi:hypothetical protein